MEIKKSAEFIRSLHLGDVNAEASADFTLPDYNGDVRKLLYTSAEVRPSGVFTSEDGVELSGICVFEAVYLDNEGEISSTSFTADYDTRAKCPEGFSDCIADTRLTGYTLRLTGPRRLSAKAGIAAAVRVTVNETLGVEGSAFNMPEAVELKTKGVKMRAARSVSPVEREYAERLATLEGAIADEVRLIHSVAQAHAESAAYESGGVIVKGEIRMTAILKNGDEPAYSIEKVIPFEELLPLEGAVEGAFYSPFVTVTSLTSSVNPEADGCSVVLNCILEIGCTEEFNSEAEAVTDGYMLTHEVKPTYRETGYSELADICATGLSVTHSPSRADIGAEGLREVIYVTSTVKGEAIAAEDGVEIKGEIRYSGICSEVTEDGGISYVPIKYSAEFCEKVKSGCQITEDTAVEVKLTPTKTVAKVDAEKLILTSDIEARIVLLHRRRELLLASLDSLGEALSASTARVTVYYPEPGESLFSVAKKFHVTEKKLAADNSLAESVSAVGAPSLSGVKRLMIIR